MPGKPAGPAVPAGGSPAVPPSPERIRAQAQLVQKSSMFAQSERLRRFLSRTVELTLSGQADQIKEYTLGRDVFDRDQAFDPRVDSIVRVEARRLRRKLSEYYKGPGADDPILIEYPQGSYVPNFLHKSAAGGPTVVAFPPAEARALNPRTVAVLPFVNLSPDPDQDFFCDGITEEILNTLAAIPQLSIVARTSVFHFKGVRQDIRRIGEQLGAGTVIEGSVRKSGERLRIAAQAIDASRGVLLWTDTFDRDIHDVFAVQDEIAREVASSLRVTLDQAPVITMRATRNMEAYAAYLKGVHYWNHVSKEGVQPALSEFKRAISLFPGYAPAHAGLAIAYAHMTFWSVFTPAEGMQRAKESALEALRLDPGIAGAYAVLGIMASCFEWRWKEGEALLERAIELQPSNMTSHTYFALYLICRGRFSEADVALEQATQLDPLSPWSFRNLGWYHYFQRQYEPAIQILKAALALDPRFREAQFVLAYAYLRAGRYQEALAHFEELPEGAYAAARWGAIGEAYGCAGDVARARDALQRLESLAGATYVSPINRASIYGGLGEWDRMFEELDIACQEHVPWLCLLKVDPRYEPVRNDPRFLRLLERTGLA